MRWLPVVLLATLVAGCGSLPGQVDGAGPEPPPAVEVVRERYAAGQVVDLRLHNRLDGPVGYNACTWTLQRRAGNGWRAAPHEDERVCTMELRTLDPGGTASPGFRLDPRLPPGEYRLRAVLHRMDAGTRELRISGTFRIER